MMMSSLPSSNSEVYLKLDVKRAVEVRYVASDGPPPTVQVRTPWPDLQPGAPVVLEAEVLSGGAEVSHVTAQVRWGFDAVSPLPMARDEDGLWRVEVPGDRMAPGELFRFVVEAEDTAGRTSRAPRFDDPRDADQFFGAVVEDELVVIGRLARTLGKRVVEDEVRKIEIEFPAP